MTYEQAKQIIQSMANGTATIQQETDLEAWALRTWGHERDGRQMICLGDQTPASSGQMSYPTMRACIEEKREIARRWCDVLHVHPLIGLANDGNEYYGIKVYADTYEVVVKRPEKGNFIVIQGWREHEYQTLVQLPCAEGRIKDVGGEEASERYLFERVPDGAEYSSGMILLSKDGLEKAMSDCSLDD